MGVVGAVTVTVLGGAVTVCVGVFTVTLVLCEVVTVDVTGLVTVVVDPPPFETARAIPTPAAAATIPTSTSGHARERFGRRFAPHAGQNSLPGGTLLPQLGQLRGGSGGSFWVGSSLTEPEACSNRPKRESP